jgi:nucleotide-binding universal stress UspA family protein
MIRNRLLLAIDQFEPGDAAIDFTIGHASRCGSDVVVLHVRELSPNLRVPPLESAAAARDLVELTVLRMRDAGVTASGLVFSARADTVGQRIVEASVDERCTGIVLGSRRLRGIRRLTGSRVRERVVRTSHLPVIVAPPGLRCSGRELTSLLSVSPTGS